MFTNTQRKLSPKACGKLLQYTRKQFHCSSNERREYTLHTITHIVASWRLVQLRLRHLLPYLTLRASRDILAQAIDQLDTLARADYCENFLSAK
jgi:hypothetical protein